MARSHHTKTPRRHTTPAQRAILSETQKRYVQTDPRWNEHRRKLAEAQYARRIQLLPEEVARIREMRKKGRTFSYIAEELCICKEVIERELKALGISTAPVRMVRRAQRGKGFWRCFDDP